ncbi:hypothetical protein JVT61DRAFT_1991 [Boletus reticuloceps]|uniref:Uncharacterized protein n=1 Tax=Boletus reticuloceps TaxID=495285 RepID=A0A8I2YSI7_9AGAM|nr:hypothetical protein JVT61DRAFT_1991 [Boletus reticuloceps]
MEDINWISSCMHKFGAILSSLEDAALAAAGQDGTSGELIHIIPVVAGKPGPNCGRPALQFNMHWLADAVSSTHRIPLQTLVKALGVHRGTLRQHLKTNNLNRCFSDIHNNELDELIHHYKCNRPSAGLRFVITLLKSHGLHIQRE